jgi:uncharacterized protein (TIGR02001 family)
MQTQTKLLGTLIIAALASFCAPVAFAQDGEQEEEASSSLVSTLTFVSDYRFRGISQNDNNPALQLGTTYYHESGIYGGLWGSNVDFGDAIGANLEVDTYIGWGGEVADGLTADVQLIRYNYPSSEVSIAYSEVIGKLSYEGLTGLIGYSNDVFNTDETGIYYNLGYTIKLAEEYSLSAAAGYYDLDDAYGDSITDYSVGVSKTLGDSLAVGFTYVRTNGLDEVFPGINGNKVVFSFGATF